MVTMKQRGPRGVDSTYFSDYAVGELEVAGIILRLPDLIERSEASKFPASWGAKKKRSAIDCLNTAPSPAPESAGKVDDLSKSPISPFSFCYLADSDSKPVRSSKKVCAEVEDGLPKQCGELSGIGDLLKKDLQQVKAHNRELQMIDQQVSLSLQTGQSQPLIPLFLLPHRQDHPPAVFSRQQPEGIPDLNASPEDYGVVPQPSDLDCRHRIAAEAERKAKAAAARRNRCLIQKAKKSSRVPRGRR